MSWQQYVDSSLVGSGHADKAAIVSAAGDSVWATSPNFEIKPEEMKVIVGALSDSKVADSLWSDGLYVAGERYVVFKVEGRSIYGRRLVKEDDNAQKKQEGKQGVVIVKTNLAILIAHYGENVIAGNAALTVEQLADYLIKSNY